MYKSILENYFYHTPSIDTTFLYSSNRTIRLLNNRSGDSIESLDEKQLMDHFRVSINVSTLKGSRQIKVYWCTKVDYLDSNTELPISSFVDDKTQRIKSRASKQSPIGVKPHLSSVSNITQQSRLAIIRSSRSQINGPSDSGSNVNLICFICASICILTLFLPLAIDYELCRKAKSYSEQTSAKPTGLLAQLYSILSVSYEMKFGCSFALGLFTYRLISTMPN